jgi:tRNA-Thr(GGU) m(6)t(6)A37 methyltransferase TsaA
MSDAGAIVLVPIGHVESTLTALDEAPRQGDEGAPDAWIVVNPDVAAALLGTDLGDEVVIITWLDRAQRDVLVTHPRGDTSRPESGVFATRSPDRPNPIGLHLARVVELETNRVRVDRLEAIDGTPVLDLKPMLASPDRR